MHITLGMTGQVADNDVSNHDLNVFCPGPIRFVLCHTKGPDPQYSVPCRSCLLLNRTPRENNLYDYNQVS